MHPITRTPRNLRIFTIGLIRIAPAIVIVRNLHPALDLDIYFVEIVAVHGKSTNYALTRAGLEDHLDRAEEHVEFRFRRHGLALFGDCEHCAIVGERDQRFARYELEVIWTETSRRRIEGLVEGRPQRGIGWAG